MSGPPNSAHLPPDDAAPVLIHTARSAYNEIYVYQKGPHRYMTFRPEALAPRQSTIEVENPLHAVTPTSQAHLTGAAIHGNPRRVLVLGVGAGVVPLALREAFPQASIDAVDIDAAVIAIGREWFGLSRSSGERLRLHAADARSFVRQAHAEGRRWDVIVHDAYDRDYIPAHLMTVEFFRELCSVLDEGGLVTINSYAQGELHARELSTYAVTFADMFQVLPGHLNRVVVAYPRAKPKDDILFANLLGHAHALRRVGIDAAAMAAQLRPIKVQFDEALVMTDDAMLSPELLTLRRSMLDLLGVTATATLPGARVSACAEAVTPAASRTPPPTSSPCPPRPSGNPAAGSPPP